MRQLLKVNPEIIINVGNIAYIEVTGKGGTDIYFIGNPKPLHLNVTEAEALLCGGSSSALLFFATPAQGWRKHSNTLPIRMACA